MKIDVFDEKGKKLEQLTLSDSVFGVKPNLEVLARYARSFRTNQRQGTSKAKTRGEVSGGGKKPWAQKGLGRARHGSTRSPIWRHGGTAHGPKPQNWKSLIPQSVRRVALTSILSKKVSDKKLSILKDIELKQPKTKEFTKTLDALKLDARKLLVVLPDGNVNFYKSARNISGVNVTRADNLSAYDLMNSDNVLFTKSAAEFINKKYENK